jgi:phosphoribosylanthranilate isomerase
MTQVKVCGLTRQVDVRRAVELGAWAVGFVMAASPRQVEPGDAASLVRVARTRSTARRPLTVLVFTTEEADSIAGAIALTAADAVQLSAGKAGPSVAAVRAALAAMRVAQTAVIAAADTPDAADADFVLHDARTPDAWGGTGARLEWRRLASDAGLHRERLILAGGLTPVNVAQAIQTVRPLAVDVSSGLEHAPGVKDELAMSAFFDAVAGAGARLAGAGAPPASHARMAGQEEGR